MNTPFETATTPRTRSEEFKTALGEHYYRAELICYSSLLVLGGAQIIIREQFPNVKPPWPIIVIPVMTILMAFVIVPPLFLVLRLWRTPPPLRESPMHLKPQPRPRQRRPAAINGRLLTAVIALAAVIGACLWFAWPRHRTATAYIFVPEQRSVVFNDEAPPSEAAYARTKARLIALATSPLVLEAALQSKLAPVGSTPQDLPRLQQALAVNFSGDGGVMQLSMTCFHDNPNDDCKLLDAVVRALVDHALMQFRLEQVRRDDDMRHVLEDLRAQMRDQQAAIDGTPAEAGDAALALLNAELETTKDLFRSLNKQFLKSQAVARLENWKHRSPSRPGEDEGYPVRIIQRAIVSE